MIFFFCPNSIFSRIGIPIFLLLRRILVFVRIYTFPTDILWTEFVNKNMLSDTQKFLEAARLSTLGVSVEFHSALCQLCCQCWGEGWGCLWSDLQLVPHISNLGSSGECSPRMNFSVSHPKIHSNNSCVIFLHLTIDSVFFHDSRNHSAWDDWQTDYWGSDFFRAFPFHLAVIVRRVNMQHLYSYQSTVPLCMCSCVPKLVDLIHGSKLITQPPVGLLSWQEEAFPALECQPMQH